MRVGFIGLGLMGSGMTNNLQKAGHQLVLHDLRREPAEKLIAKTLDEEKATNEKLSALAKGGINTTASKGEGIPIR